MPRSLKLPVGFAPSHLSQSSAPIRSCTIAGRCPVSGASHAALFRSRGGALLRLLPRAPSLYRMIAKRGGSPRPEEALMRSTSAADSGMLGSRTLRAGLARFALLSIFGVVLGLLAVVSPGRPAEAQAKQKLAMILPGPIQDADFNSLGYAALQEVAKAHGIEVSPSESVAVADAERVSREYIGSGYNIVAYHGGQFLTVMQKLAGQFPNVVFIQEASGRIPNAPANAWVIGRKYYQGFYALGALAALIPAYFAARLDPVEALRYE